MRQDGPGPSPATRASDEERERVVALLRDHFGAGRVTQEEFSQRVDQAYASRTVGELRRLTADLPDVPAGARVAPPARVYTRGGRALRTSVRVHAAIFVIVNVMLIGIWAASGGGYFWPIWPILGWGIGLGGHAAPLLAGVGTRDPRELRAPRDDSIEELAATVDSERPDLLPAAAPDGTVTILFSDVCGSTELNARLGDLRWLEILRIHHAVIREQIAGHGGFEVKAQGDGFMIAFPSARRAVLCALAIPAALDAALAGHPDGPLRVRIGLHTGEAIREHNDFYGRNVALAARITEQAAAGEILASAVVKQLTDSAGDIAFGPEREVELKGLGLQRVHAVARADAPLVSSG